MTPPQAVTCGGGYEGEGELQMCEHMEANQSTPEKMKRLFLKDSVRYAAE